MVAASTASKVGVGQIEGVGVADVAESVVVSRACMRVTRIHWRSIEKIPGPR